MDQCLHQIIFIETILSPK